MDSTQADDERLRAIAAALNLLRSWHTAHLEQDHADIDAQIVALRRRIARIESALKLGRDINACIPATPQPKRSHGRPRKHGPTGT